jgi:hypothetical protein
MPTYNFRDSTTGKTFEEWMQMSEREQFLQDNPNLVQVPPTQMNIVAGIGTIKTDSGFQENLHRIASAHPTSALGAEYGSKSIKDVKVRQAVEKWKKKSALDVAKT